MRSIVLTSCILLVMFCASLQGYETITFMAGRMADGTPGPPSYDGVGSAALQDGQPDWDGSIYSAPWAGGDFSYDTARMMPIKFRDLFGSGPIQIPAGAIIFEAKLKLNVWEAYQNGASAVRAYTGLTDWYSTGYAQSGGSDGDFSTAAWRMHDAGVAWDGGSEADRPRHGIDYTSTYADAAINPTSGSELYSINQYVQIDVTSDVIAFANGSLTNNGWWIGTNTYMYGGTGPYGSHCLYRIGGAYAGSVLMPSLVVKYALSCADLPPEMKNVSDFDGDCLVNLVDLAIFAQNWLDCTNPQGCD